MRKNLKKSAFTLAEVLITLTIIGVIAAIVIPNLMQRNLEHEMVTKLKKNYNVLNNAVAMAVRENGPATEWEIGDSGDTKAEKADKLYAYLKPYLKIQRECGSGSTGTAYSKCFANTYKALFVGTAFNSINGVSFFNRFTLTDGTAIAVESSYGKGCSGTKCAGIFIDLNGKKGPNRFGVDMFRFLLRANGTVVPSGIGEKNLITSEAGGGYVCEYGNPSNKNGYNCGMHVLYKGNMDYLRHDIKSEWP